MPFIVGLGGRKYRFAVPIADIASDTIKLRGCLTVGVVYFSSYLFPAGLHSLHFLTENCFIEDLSEKSTVLSSTYQWSGGHVLWQNLGVSSSCLQSDAAFKSICGISVQIQ